jgi:hypothetical protein
VASGVELDLLRRVQALEQQVQQLSTTQRDETLQPTNNTINPATGAVGALFSGGVQVPESPIDTYNADDAIGWVSTDRVIRDYILGVVNGAAHELHMNARADGPTGADLAELKVSSQAAGGLGSAVVSAVAQDSAGGGAAAVILNSLGGSSFLQLAGGATQVAIAYGSSTLTWPGGTTFSNNPTIAHGLGRIPQGVFYTAQYLSANPFSAYVFENGVPDTYDIHPEGCAASPPANGTTCPFWWMVIG